MSVFTIYCCGTKFHRGSNDVVARLWRQTAGPSRINDGPGGGSWTPNILGGRANAGGANKLTGMLFGVGVDANVEDTIREVAGHKPMPRVVNICGWSRGAVTCSKIANLMQRMGPPMSAMAVNIFAIDPVPGSNAGSGHMWQSIEITPNVRYYTAILAQHDLRGVDDFFQPTYPAVGGSTIVEVDQMPGSHSSILVFKETTGNQQPAELVEDIAKRFLMSHGTAFGDRKLFSGAEILNRYAHIQENFEYHTRLKGKQLRKLEDLGRVVMDVNKKAVGKLSMGRPRFFVNEHHRETFRMSYPGLTTEIDRDPPAAPGAHARGWADRVKPLLQEFNKLKSDCVEQSETVMTYFLAQGGA